MITTGWQDDDDDAYMKEHFEAPDNNDDGYGPFNSKDGCTHCGYWQCSGCSGTNGTIND